MGIYKKGNNFYIDYYFEGRRKREKVGPSKKLAEAVLGKRLVEIAEEKFLDVQRTPKIPIEEMIEKYLEWARANKRSWKRDEYSLQRLNECFSGKFLTDISPFLIEGYKIRRKDEVSPRTVDIEIACLKRLFTKAIEWGFAKENPVKKVKLFAVNNARLRFLTEEEIVRLLSACRDNLKPIVTFAIHTGMRRGEILNLKWSEVDFRVGIINVAVSKNGEGRKIPMNETVEKTLLELKKNSGFEFLFRNRCDRDKPAKDIRTAFANALKKAGISDFRFHDLRHTFASHLVMNGVDLKSVQELLGHKTFTMTLRYSHLSPQHKKEAIRVLDKLDGHQMDTNGVSTIF